MIVLVSVANCRSFLTEETFSLVASKHTSHQTHVIPIPGAIAQVLKTSVLYGANGAGKSNLFKALRYLKMLVLKPRNKNSGTGREVFRFAENTSEQPSRFDLQFITQGKLYRFGCAVTSQHIIEEWLVQIIDGQEKIVYERITDENGKVTIEARNDNNMGKKLAALMTVGGPPNQTFLATIRATLDETDYGEEISAVLSWFEDNLTLIAPDASFGTLGVMLANDSVFREFAGTFLKASATGVSAIKAQKQEITEEALHNLLPESLVSRLLDNMTDDEQGKASVPLGQDKELLIERSNKNHYYRLTIQTEHKHHQEKSISLDLSEESDGTRRLLNLIPALHYLHNSNAVYFIDEIDRSIHPMLVWKFLEFFLKSTVDGQRQIIVTTHESHLLDLDLLRRDEIWFAEKAPNGATHLYSLSDFEPRKDLDIRKHYLQGRFSAIPFLGNLEQLLEETK
jgi:AAA15 family ATPase/GTPase